MSDFLQSGRLGDVQLGLRPEQVIEVLGTPEDQSIKKRPVQLLRYGAVEFGFMPIPQTTDSRLVSIAMYFDPDRLIPVPLRPTDWMPTHITTAPEFREFLDRAGIEARCNGEGPQEQLMLSSGASVVFVEQKLHSIHVHRKTPQRRQITVSLQEESVKKLRDRAQAERLSVQALIERLIEAAA